MKFIAKAFLYFTLTTGATQVAADEAAAQQFVEKIESIGSLQGNFTQIIRDHEQQEVQTTEGRFKLKRPGLFFWEVAPPYEQLVVGNLNTLTVYDPDLEQATIYNSSAMENSPAVILSGNVKTIVDEYQIEQSQDKENKVLIFTLKPNDKEAGAFDTLVFVYQKNILTKLLFTDKLGQSTEVVFSQLETNIPVEDALFQFTPPAGTDVIINEQ